MTCIVGVEHAGGVTIGADAAGSTQSVTVARADSKLFRVGGYLIGFTASFRMGQLLHWSFKPSPPKGDLERHMCTTFVDEVRACLAEGGFAEKVNNVETGGTFLVGVDGLLFCVESDFQVGRNLDGYAACGSGEEFAFGSLHTTGQYDIEPDRRVRLALEAAARHNPFVGPPFTIKTV